MTGLQLLFGQQSQGTIDPVEDVTLRDPSEWRTLTKPHMRTDILAKSTGTQVYGIDLTLAQLALLSATTVGASIGAPSTPGVGIVILATIVQGLGVPAEGIALILGVDRILDMTRTAVNVSGDLTACTVMERWLSEDERSSGNDSAST